MKCNAKLSACILRILVSAFVLTLIIVAEAGLHSQGAPGALSSGVRESVSEATPTVADDIWGPEVGPPSEGKSVPLAPLPISEDQIAANSTIVSDDFNGCALNTAVWTFTDPVEDSTYEVVGTFTEDARLSISVPGGSSHDIWEDGNFAPRIMQSVSNSDFEVEVKFDSGVSQMYQMQGILVEQAIDHFVRFEFHSDGTETKLFAAVLEPAPPGSDPPLEATVRYNQGIADNNLAPLHMRVRREGDQWTLYYRDDDSVNWTTAVTFAHALTVTKIGTYAANADSSPPAHTGYIDYFFNTASPIDPEDGERNTLTVDIVGNGSVDIDPVKSNYDCGDEVTLEAEPDPGASFSGWGGDLSSAQNPATIAMDGAKNVVANFGYRTLLPLASKAPFTNYLFVGDFETGDLTGFYWQHNEPEVVSVNTPVELGPGPPHPVRGGSYSMRSYLHRYDSEFSFKTMVHLSSDDSNPPGTQSTFRFGIAQEYWLGFSVYVQDDFVIDKPGVGELVFQVQASPDPGEDYRSPILAMEIDEDKWKIKSQWDTRRTTPDETFTGSAIVYEEPLGSSIGSWTDWVFHIEWSYQSDGFLEVWRSGEFVGSRTGPNCSNDEEGPYPSFGIYKWPWKPGNEDDYPPSNTDWRLFYHDELRIAGVDGNYWVVAP